MSEERFNSKERGHLEVLRLRLAHLRVNDPSRSGDPAYPPGEAPALEWILRLVTDSLDPIEIRFQRIEKGQRALASRIGRVEAWIKEEDEDV